MKGRVERRRESVSPNEIDFICEGDDNFHIFIGKRRYETGTNRRQLKRNTFGGISSMTLCKITKIGQEGGKLYSQLQKIASGQPDADAGRGDGRQRSG